LLSLRVSSAAYTPERSGGDDPNNSAEAVYARTLAAAIVHAANSGADVIAVPQPACMAANQKIDRDAVGAAVRYATTTKNALVIASSGNVGVGGCSQNPPYSANPNDPRGWDAITTVSTPSEFSDDVLSVGMTTLAGEPTDKTLQGPWVGIAAPGTGFVTTSSDGASLTDSVTAGDGATYEIAGSAYATAIVAGTAALLRSRYPSYSAVQIRDLLTDTAHHPPRGVDNLVGAGLVDPLTALAGNAPPKAQYHNTEGAPVRLPDPPPPVDPAPVRNATIIAVAALLVAAGVPVAMKLRKPEGERSNG
jgi:membrane-anchored mycosin MYCP